MKAGWQVKPLGDLCKMYQPKTLSKRELSENGQYPVFGANGIIGWHDEYNHEEPELLIGCRGACGTVHVSTPKSWINGNSMVVRPREDILSRDFLRYFFLGPAKLQDVITGAAQPQITQSALQPIATPIPPLDEQKRIVAVLDEAFEGLDRARANAEANLADARELLGSAIENALRQVRAEERTLDDMIANGEIISHFDGNHGANYPKKDEFVENGVPYISANCISGREIDMTKCKFLSSERADTLKKGTSYHRDVIFAHNATVGPVALLTTDEPRVLLSTSLTHYRCNEERLIPEFLVFEMRSAAFKRQYESVMRQATRNQVPISIQRTFTHNVPSIDDQRKIVAMGVELEDSVASLEEGYIDQMKHLTALRQSLLQKAFSGELG